jgi:hypothetical protein
MVTFAITADSFSVPDPDFIMGCRCEKHNAGHLCRMNLWERGGNGQGGELAIKRTAMEWRVAPA